MIRDRTKRIVRTVGAVLLVTLLVGNLLGYPTLLSFVETDSMSPTMDPDDGFVAIPEPVAGSIDEGDVVVFRAQRLDGGGLTTHRVVNVTDEGFVTKGDGNPFTDQQSGEPLVKRAQVVAVAFQFGGNVVTIPKLGAPVDVAQSIVRSIGRWITTITGMGGSFGARGLALLLFGVSAVLFVASDGESGRDRKRTRSRNRDGVSARAFVLILVSIVVLTTTASMIVPSGTTEYGVVSAENPSPRGTVIQAGETGSVNHQVRNRGLLPTETYVSTSSDGVNIETRRIGLSPGGERSVDVGLTAPTETGYYRRYVHTHQYLALLPTSITSWLYGIHPWAPILAIDTLIGGSLYVVGIAMIGTGRIRDRSPSSDRPTNGSLWDRLSKLLYRD